MRRIAVRKPSGRLVWAACYEPHEWARLPWYLKLYSWACCLAAIARGVRPL